MKYTDGTAVNGCDDHWTVICPECGREIEYYGFFDPDDINECQCGCEFITQRVWLDSEIFI
jgi:hypothetical protein